MVDTPVTHINEEAVEAPTDGEASLLSYLRYERGLLGVRSGCIEAGCGACTVLVDGAARRSCAVSVDEVAGSRITTPEGLGTPEAPGPVQEAFLTEAAAQCGYCINGIISSVEELRVAGQVPTEEALRSTLDRHICRCGAHPRILRAARRVLGLPPIDDPSTLTHAPPLTDPDEVEEARMDACWGGPGVYANRTPPDLIGEHPRVGQWLRIRPDSSQVEILSGRVELGQGVHEAMRHVVASQIGIDARHVTVTGPTTGRSPDEGYTSSSASLQEGGAALARVAQAFRRLMLERAAELIDGAVDLHPDGTIHEVGGSKKLTLADLGSVDGDVRDDDVASWHEPTLAANGVREDLVKKLTGSAAYVHDHLLPGQLFAQAVLPPTYEATLIETGRDQVLAMDGVVEVVQDGNLLIVIAETDRQLSRAIGALTARTRWNAPPLELDADHLGSLAELPTQAHVAREDDVTRPGPILTSARYSRPYQAHGAVAPSCAVALQEPGGALAVWTHSQGVYPLRRELSTLLGLSEDAVVVHHLDGPGCYGHNAADDVAGFAAIAARAVPGHPVRFAFSVEDEFGWEPYGSAMQTDLRVSVDQQGRIVTWDTRTLTDSHRCRPDGRGDRLVPSWLSSKAHERPWNGPSPGGARNIIPIYDVPAVSAIADHVRGPIRTSALRSLGSFLHVFAIESCMDEVAQHVAMDPLELRLINLSDLRARAVLERLAEHVGWQERVGPSGRGLGLAVARYSNAGAYLALAAEVAFDTERGRVQVQRVVAFADAGTVVDADGLRNQVEGGIVQGLSRTLHEQLHADRRGILSRDWESYETVNFSEIPRIEVHLINRPGAPPLGVGEVAPPLVPAAVSNAVDDAIGIRLRDLPFTPQNVEKRLLTLDEVEMARVLM